MQCNPKAVCMQGHFWVNLCFIPDSSFDDLKNSHTSTCKLYYLFSLWSMLVGHMDVQLPCKSSSPQARLCWSDPLTQAFNQTHSHLSPVGWHMLAFSPNSTTAPSSHFGYCPAHNDIGIESSLSHMCTYHKRGWRPVETSRPIFLFCTWRKSQLGERTIHVETELEWSLSSPVCIPACSFYLITVPCGQCFMAWMGHRENTALKIPSLASLPVTTILVRDIREVGIWILQLTSLPFSFPAKVVLNQWITSKGKQSSSLLISGLGPSLPTAGLLW